jgi:hypothetical protein
VSLYISVEFVTLSWAASSKSSQEPCVNKSDVISEVKFGAPNLVQDIVLFGDRCSLFILVIAVAGRDAWVVAACAWGG